MGHRATIGVKKIKEIKFSLTYISILNAVRSKLVEPSINIIPKNLTNILQKQEIVHFHFGRHSFGENPRLQAHICFGEPGISPLAALEFDVTDLPHPSPRAWLWVKEQVQKTYS